MILEFIIWNRKVRAIAQYNYHTIHPQSALRNVDVELSIGIQPLHHECDQEIMKNNFPFQCTRHWLHAETEVAVSGLPKEAATAT